MRNLLLVIISAGLTLLLLEGLLRVAFTPADLVRATPTLPELNQRHNELDYWLRYRERPASELAGHDPLLGWDAGTGDSRVRGKTVLPPKAGLRAVAVGDSFVFGNEVAAEETFAALLDQADNGLEVLNMAVPGYGIDQSYLKYRHFGAPLNPDVVLFGIYVSDYERSTVAFTAAAKPRFVLDGSSVVLTNQPVPSPAAELERIGGSLTGRWHLALLADNLTARLARNDPAAYFTSSDRIIGHLLRTLRESLGPEQRLLVIHFPRGESFLDPDPLHQEMHRRLLGLYEAQSIEHIDLSREFPAVLPASEVAEAFYVVRPSGSVGHLNPEGHHRVAALISRRLGLPTADQAPIP